jgi:hypothetical protein
VVLMVGRDEGEGGEGREKEVLLSLPFRIKICYVILYCFDLSIQVRYLVTWR